MVHPDLLGQRAQGVNGDAQGVLCGDAVARHPGDVIGIGQPFQGEQDLFRLCSVILSDCLLFYSSLLASATAARKPVYAATMSAAVNAMRRPSNRCAPGRMAALSAISV